MVINKEGQTYKVRGINKTFRIGGTVKANSSTYAGLTGMVFEIRTGRDKDTDNSGPDIYVAFDRPEDPELIKALEKRFSDLYKNPMTLDEVCLDEVIMAPEMLDVIDSEDKPFTRKREGRSFTFRMCANILFNRAVDPDKGDYVSPGGYEFVMNGKTVTFDFCEYEGGRKPNHPNILEFVQKNPDYSTFEDLENVTEEDLKHVEEIKEFYIYLGEDGESVGLEPVRIIGLWFEVFPFIGKSYTIECKNVIPYVFPKDEEATA